MIRCHVHLELCERVGGGGGRGHLDFHGSSLASPPHNTLRWDEGDLLPPISCATDDVVMENLQQHTLTDHNTSIIQCISISIESLIKHNTP